MPRAHKKGKSCNILPNENPFSTFSLTLAWMFWNNFQSQKQKVFKNWIFWKFFVSHSDAKHLPSCIFERVSYLSRKISLKMKKFHDHIKSLENIIQLFFLLLKLKTVFFFFVKCLGLIILKLSFFCETSWALCFHRNRCIDIFFSSFGVNNK